LSLMWKIRPGHWGGWNMRKPKVKIVVADSDIFVIADGVKIAKRGRPGTAQAKTWVSLEPGWSVLDVNYPEGIEVTFQGVRVH
jgi:hypothetical protein